MPDSLQHTTDPFDLRSYLSRYFRKKHLYFISFIICLGLAALYWWLSVPKYRIQATLVIKDEKKGETNSATVKELEFLDEQKIVDNEAEIVKSETVISNVVERLNLNIGYYKKEKLFLYQPLYTGVPVNFRLVRLFGSQPVEPLDIAIKNNEQYFLDNKLYRFGDTVTTGNITFVLFKIGVPSPPSLRIRVSTIEATAQYIRQGIGISTPTKSSSVLHISLLHPSPETGKVILQQIIEEYNNANIRDKRTQTDAILSMIEDRLSLISGQLNEYENKEQNFKVQRGITNLSDDSKMYLEKVKDNDKNISENKILLDILSALENYVNNTSGMPAPSHAGINDPVLLGMINRLGQLEIEKENLMRTTGEINPLVTAKNNQIRDIRASILQNLNVQRQNIQNTLNQLMNNKRNIDSQISTVPGNERNLLEIIREKNIRENVYTFLLQKREEASLTNAAAFSEMRIIDRPYSSATPVKPNKMVVVAAALFLAVLLPTVFINVQYHMYNKVTGRTMVENRLPGSLLGELPHIKHFNYLVFDNKVNPVAEQFRRLRTNINRQLEEKTPAAVLVTSSVPGEGKTFISINLAIGFALQNKKTILLDFDFRDPRLHTVFNLQADAGLYRNMNNVKAIIHQHPDIPTLFMAGEAHALSMPPEFSEDTLNQLFQYLENEYEFIIINTPPYKLFSEAALLDRFCDLSLIVIRHHYTDLKYLDDMQHNLYADFDKPFIVYNDVPLNELHSKNIYRSRYFKNA